MMASFCSKVHWGLSIYIFYVTFNFVFYQNCHGCQVILSCSDMQHTVLITISGFDQFRPPLRVSNKELLKRTSKGSNDQLMLILRLQRLTFSIASRCSFTCSTLNMGFLGSSSRFIRQWKASLLVCAAAVRTGVHKL